MARSIPGAARDQAQATLRNFLRRYGPAAGADGPVRLVNEVFGVTLDPWQEQVLRDFGAGEPRISIRSCHGVGKTAVLAWCVWAMLLTRFPQNTIATAPTRGQLFDGLFAEIRLWGNRLHPELLNLFRIKADRIELRPAPAESFFSARTARPENPEALQGVHSDHVLLICDEASGIPEKIFVAGSGSMSGRNATTILAGNPVRTSGLFFDSHHKLRDIWRRYHIRAAPAEWETGIPSDRVTEDFVIDCARRYGEQSNAYRVRVLGEFPLDDGDTLIPYGTVISARQRDLEVKPDLPRVWGLDVARFGSAKNALVIRNQRKVIAAYMWSGTDMMATAGRVKAIWDDTPPQERPRAVLIDVIGLGAGVADRLEELRIPVRGINVAEAATMAPDRFRNLRSELWWAAREWLMKQDVFLPSKPEDQDHPLERLATELVQPRYKYMSTGRIAVEPKADMRRRGLPSPDLADAFVLTFADPAFLHPAGGELGLDWSDTLPLRVGGIP